MPRKTAAPPFAKNGLPTDYLFYQRKYYKLFPEIYPTGPGLPKPIDLWEDKKYYGKVDTLERFVYPKTDSLKVIYKDLQTVNFVADALYDFVGFVDRAAASFRTCMTSFIDVSKPVKAHTSLVDLYFDYFSNTLNHAFIDLFTTPQQKNEILNFDDFMNQYINYAIMNSDQPHTLVSFLRSDQVSNRCSGLIIDFTKESQNDNHIKWKKYLSNDFFTDYMKIAAQFGFYINKNAPWSIVANLSSKNMKKYMLPYGVGNADQHFYTNCFQAEYISYESFKKYMFGAYKGFLSPNNDGSPSRIEKEVLRNCVRDSVFNSTFSVKRVVRDRTTEFKSLIEITYEEFISIYPERYFIEKYLQVRLLESGFRLNKRKQYALLRRVFRQYKYSNVYETMIFLQKELFNLTP